MQLNQEHYLVIYTTMIFVLGMSAGGLLENAYATGCPVETIIPFIDDAIKSLEAGDIKTAQSQLQDAKNELADTFEVEE